jgi:lysophospholipase L1-like esterase
VHRHAATLQASAPSELSLPTPHGTVLILLISNCNVRSRPTPTTRWNPASATRAVLLALGICSNVDGSVPAALADNKPAAHATAANPAVLDNPCIRNVGATCSAHALDAFAASVHAQKQATATAPIRLTFIGDSLTADDQIVDRVRTSLQRTLGNGGPGFVFVVPPHPFCQQRAATRSLSGTWTARGVIGAAEADHLMGLGGSSATAVDDARFVVKTTTPVESADIFYLAAPNSGTFEFIADKVASPTVSAKAAAKTAMFDRTTFAQPVQQVTLQTHGRVRVFGVVFENSRGAVVDNLGVVNGTAKTLLRNNQAHWMKQLAHRAPALTIIMLGTNEAEWLPAAGPALDEHEQLFGHLLDSIHDANPTQSCLVISPFDQLDWRKPDAPPRTSIPAMVAVQHRVATSHGCAFWNTYEWMGGAGSSRAWAKQRLVTNDFQHPTTKGAHRIGDALAAALLN